MLLNRLLARRRVITIVMAAAFGLLLLASGAGTGADGLMHVLRDGIRSHPASGEVHIVEIDAKSIAAIAKWPWPRARHAQAVDRLSRAGVRSIAFDVDFSASSDPRNDRILAAALHRAGGNVVMPAFRQQSSAGSSDQIENIPAKPFLPNSFMAAVTVVPDADGYVRQMPLGLEVKGAPRPSLASMVAETGTQSERYFDVDYSIDPSSIPRHSFIDLIEGKVPATALAGKRVLIGATAIELGDRYVVPRHGVIPGVVVQALAAETLLGGSVPTRLGPVPLLVLALLLVALCVRPGSRGRRITAFTLGSFVVCFGIPLLAEAYCALSLEVAPAMTALASAALIAAIVCAAERYRARALADPSTGLPNLAALEEAAGQDATLLVVARLERFNAIAAGLGPDVAAKVVLRVADRLLMANHQRTIYRIDDVSLAWIERADDADSLEDRLEAITRIMRSPVDCGRLVDITLNLGMADCANGDAKQALANASLAAIHAARKGLRWLLFSGVDNEDSDFYLSLLSELDAAMTSGQLWNAYQPQMDLATGRIVGVEALVRWLHPQRGPIAPDNFIPLVEKHGRARDLTLHVLARALEDAAQWDASGLPIGIAVNVSASLLADSDFIELVRRTLNSSAVKTERITIEVTETAAMQDPEMAIAALESWRATGVGISIDDYGTGQSSLNYLQKLPATELKIDQSFVRGVDLDDRSAIMVRSTIALAHELGIKVVAEGIEDGECLRRLTEMGCDTGQGYYIGRPMSASNLRVFLVGSAIQAA
jgi:EAL domain-containing protein (putative c-di-GMP-specific phosphodiesterase class I)/CHASE2 domain-containing sensor protein